MGLVLSLFVQVLQSLAVFVGTEPLLLFVLFLLFRHGCSLLLLLANASERGSGFIRLM